MPHTILNTQTDNCHGAFHIARPSPLGNPYIIGHDGDGEEVMERYREWILSRIEERDPVVCTALLGIRPGQPLACSCTSSHCHGNVISKLMEGGIQQQLRTRSEKTMRYAGIGSRSTPEHVLRAMHNIAHRLSELGYTLLSGGASGADSAFEEGAGWAKKIYLPWPDFRNLQGPQYITQPSSEASRVAEVVHPAGSRLNHTARALMARNSHQVLGTDLKSPVDFVVCWTPDGCATESGRTRVTGGTGQAIALADRWGVPVINLAKGKAAMLALAKLVSE